MGPIEQGREQDFSTTKWQPLLKQYIVYGNGAEYHEEFFIRHKAISMCKFPAVISEFAQKVNTVYTVKITIRDTEENLLKRAEYSLCYYHLLFSEVLER